MSEKNCMNCMRMVPLYDGVERTGQECMNNHGMRVNARMCCEEWRSDDITTMTEPPVFGESTMSNELET